MEEVTQVTINVPSWMAFIFLATMVIYIIEQSVKVVKEIRRRINNK